MTITTQSHPRGTPARYRMWDWLATVQVSDRNSVDFHAVPSYGVRRSMAAVIDFAQRQEYAHGRVAIVRWH